MRSSSTSRPSAGSPIPDSPDPLFLTVDDVLELHQVQLERFGGTGGILNPTVLASAVDAPQWTWHYERCDLFMLAATYLVHLVGNHPFADGNKRTALYAAVTFLGMNGIPVEWTSPLLEEDVRAVAAGQLGKPGIARTLRRAAGYPTGTAE